MGNISESEAKHLADAAKVKWDGRCTDMGGVSGFNKNLDAVRTENWANSFIATVNCDKNGKDIAENVSSFRLSSKLLLAVSHFRLAPRRL